MGKGIPALVISIALVFGWSIAWGLALSWDRSAWAVMLPGLGLGMLCANVARHAWGGAGNNPRIVLTGLLLFVVIAAMAFTTPILLSEARVGEVYVQSIPGLITGLAGVLLTWLAWWGAVEPIPARVQAQGVQAQAAATAPPQTCGICGMPVTADVMVPCPHGCGKVFHQGCHRARMSVFRGDARICALCSRELTPQA
jgi:hypothetical protein